LARPGPGKQAPRFALVGGDTLLGKELQEVLENRAKGTVIVDYSATGQGNFGEQEGEAVYLEPLTAAAIANVNGILLAGSAEGAEKAYTLAKEAGGKPILIDCTGQLEQQPEARIVAPILGETAANKTWLIVIAHPAAMALALVLQKLARYRPIQRAVTHIFEPASERGKRGVSELHQQTTSLLSFKPLDKAVFDAQLAFNLLPQYGEEAPGKLSAVEQRIERHVATILANQPQQNLPMPSLHLIQAPVFHGYSLSLWIEFGADVKTEELGEALASAQIEVRGSNDEAPNNVAAASQSGLMAGDIRLDHNNSRAAWLWVVCDNLRVTADAVADIVSELGAR
jgi:aspartate-semialdehyde dehydrogenase